VETIPVTQFLRISLKKQILHFMLKSNRIIQSLWVKGTLKSLQRLCIKSFLDNGHEFHLYTYNPDINAPTGTVIKDAKEIIANEKVFLDSRGTLACFSDWFRYELLYEKGGWWVDADQLCLKAFDFDSDYVFSSEHAGGTFRKVNTNAIKVPPHSDIISYCLRFVRNSGSLDGSTWGIMGPDLFNSYFEKYREHNVYVHAPHVFCPVPYYYYYLLFNDILIDFTEKTYGVHFWNEMLRINKIDVDIRFPENSFYERSLSRLQ
jgi:hypothetical protein